MGFARWAVAALLVTAVPVSAGGSAAAQNYPERAITLVVPYSPSTGIDIVARLIGPKITERWGHPVVIDNRPGNSGNIGAYAVSSAKPDGYTLMVTVITFAMTPALTKQLPYDPIADFTPIAEVATGAMALAVNPDKLPVTSVAALIAYAKQHPGQLNYASPGNGTPQHLGVELLKQRLGVVTPRQIDQEVPLGDTP